eukprot:13179540-Alexandrium_andersonii.AAC.1
MAATTLGSKFSGILAPNLSGSTRTQRLRSAGPCCTCQADDQTKSHTSGRKSTRLGDRCCRLVR